MGDAKSIIVSGVMSLCSFLLKVLREAGDKTQSESLLNALRYTTKNLNSDATPRNIRSLLEAPL